MAIVKKKRAANAKTRKVTKKKSKMATMLDDIPDDALATADKQGDVLDLEMITFHWLEAEIVGVSPLVTNRFSDKALKAIEEAQQGGNAGKKLKKPPREPADEFMQAAHICKGKADPAWLEKNIYGFPAVALKKAMANGNYRYGGAKDKVSQMGAFHVHGPWHGLIEVQDLKGKPSIPDMGSDYVKLPNGAASISYRPYYFPWKMQVFLRYCPTLMSKAELVHALYIAGNCIGIGSWRTEKTGDKGSFEVGAIKYHGSDFQPPLLA
jgi:hypothetical protein